MIWKTVSMEIMGLDYQLDRKNEKGITGMTTFYLGKEQIDGSALSKKTLQEDENLRGGEV